MEEIKRQRLDFNQLDEYQAQVHQVDAPVSVHFVFPLPDTVLELRTLAGAVQHKYIKSESGTVVGTGYFLMADANPLGFIEAPVATSIYNRVEQLAAAMRALVDNRPVEDPAWHYRSVTEILQDAQAFQGIRSKYGNIETRLKPGPDPRSMEEVIEIVGRWRKWKQGGHSQDEFCAHQGWGSRKILSDCLRRYRASFGPTSI